MAPQATKIVPIQSGVPRWSCKTQRNLCFIVTEVEETRQRRRTRDRVLIHFRLNALVAVCSRTRWAAGDIAAPSCEHPHKMRGPWYRQTMPCTLAIQILISIPWFQRHAVITPCPLCVICVRGLTSAMLAGTWKTEEAM